MDGILEEVQPSYIEMERLWADEVGRLTKALKDRRLDPKDIDHWGGFQERLKQTMTDWKVCLSSGPGRRSSGFTRLQKSVSSGVAPEYGLGSNAAFAAKKMRLSASASYFAKGTNGSLMLQAESKFTKNYNSCVEFFDECVYYGKNTSFKPYSPFSRSRASQDLVDRATKLGKERKEVVEYTAIQGASLHNLVFILLTSHSNPTRCARVQLHL